MNRFGLRDAAQIALRVLQMAFVVGALPSLTVAQWAQAAGTIVIDPGHGGADFGTVYHSSKGQIAEKDITLLLAREAARQLRTRGFRVVLTRASDRELSLASRTALANRLGADLFLSIHMNSAPGRDGESAEGVETYILNNASDASSKRLAHLENSVITPAAVNGLEGAEGMDVALILKDLRLDANLSESKRLACSLQNRLVLAASTGRSRNRGVKQALFHVLLGADMPSVLVEAGFLSSARDRAIVLSQAGRRALAFAIAQAVEGYRYQKNSPQALLAVSRCKIH